MLTLEWDYKSEDHRLLHKKVNCLKLQKKIPKLKNILQYNIVYA